LLETSAGQSGHFHGFSQRQHASGIEGYRELFLKLSPHFRSWHSHCLYGFVWDFKAQRHLNKNTACPEEDKFERGRACSSAEVRYSLSSQNTQNHLQQGQAGGKRMFGIFRRTSLHFSEVSQKLLDQRRGSTVKQTPTRFQAAAFRAQASAAPLKHA
jgi:hypothetical protein